ncbi:MAG: hypothetical protein FJZ11_06625 [Candidatus Omnitrophica bacterium]|nr:hypothetical protein [Candidatus Omnitrophota bacterium]
MFYFNNRCSLSLIEFLIVLCVIFIFLGVFAIYANVNLRAARETALKNELNNIRMSVELYRVINGRLPEDLVNLVNQEFTLRAPDGTILKKQFLKPFRVDKEGYLLDPFMNRYVYISQDGKITSGTKRYESW